MPDPAPVIAYGIAAMRRRSRQTRDTADQVATEVRLEGYGSRSVIARQSAEGPGEDRPGELRLPVPGRHSVQNALAAVAVGLELDVPFANIAAALADFAGAERRFEHRGVVDGSPSSMTTGTTRPRSPPCSPPRARRSHRGSWSRFSRTATRGRAT